ncbi:hypothetical protein BDW72DRAFT_2716 [Aspergillus terricola var. indicus]
MAKPQLSSVFKPDRRTHDAHPCSLIMICSQFCPPCNPPPFLSTAVCWSYPPRQRQVPFLVFSLLYSPSCLCLVLSWFIALFFPSVVYTWYL